MSQPLAEKMRPANLTEVVGQKHLVATGKIIHQIIANKLPTSIILWGPPGTGKTTLARIIADQIGIDCIELSAVTAGKADVLKAVTHAQQNKRLAQETILFVDEIHRFNKAQQDTLLPYVEDGTIILIGATTENPSFEVITPLLSRSRVLVLNPLTADDIVAIIKKVTKVLKISRKRLPLASIDYLAQIADGDARVALGNLELALQLTSGSITKTVIESAAQKRLPGYDKKGDMHYKIISAFIKSLRGSDANAALYYLARMLQAGEDPKFIARRMVVFASEDVGIASSPVLNLSVSTFLAVERIGMPECQYNMYHCALVLAKCAKSRVVTDAMHTAQQIAEQHAYLAVPLHVRNAPTDLMKDLGYGKGTKWEANFKHPQGFLPPELADLDLFVD